MGGDAGGAVSFSARRRVATLNCDSGEELLSLSLRAAIGDSDASRRMKPKAAVKQLATLSVATLDRTRDAVKLQISDMSPALKSAAQLIAERVACLVPL